MKASLRRWKRSVCGQTSHDLVGVHRLKADLPHILWIGGSPCSGKSTVADVLGERYDVQTYHVDDGIESRHARAVEAPDEYPHMAHTLSLSRNDLWMRDADIMLRDALAFMREEFAMVRTDLAAVPSSRPILAEGCTLLPECVRALDGTARGIWMVPTEGFLRSNYTPENRPWVNDILADCDDPDQAFANWMARDVATARYVADDAEAHGQRVVHVDGSRTIDDTVALVAHHLGLVEDAAQRS